MLWTDMEGIDMDIDMNKVMDMDEDEDDDIGSHMWRTIVLVVAFIVMIVGTVGNTLTLAAIGYVGRKYPTEFVFLQLSVTNLLINLSVCDLVYCAFGLPHMIHGQLIGGNPYDEGNLFCRFQGTVRNWIVVADFNTMGAIAFYVCMYHYCGQCREDGGHQNHCDHEKKRVVYCVILAIWIVAFISISPDVFGWLGEYKWTGLRYGCDGVYEKESDTSLGTEHTTNWGYPSLVIINLVVMVVSYGLVFYQILKRTSDHSFITIDRIEQQRVRSHMTMLVTLSLTYAVCILPAMTFSWGLRPDNDEDSEIVKNVTTCIYWFMYAINFVLYVLTSSRMRDMYKIFLTDLIKKFGLPRQEIPSNFVSPSSNTLSAVCGRRDVVIDPVNTTCIGTSSELDFSPEQCIKRINGNDVTGEAAAMAGNVCEHSCSEMVRNGDIRTIGSPTDNLGFTCDEEFFITRL